MFETELDKEHGCCRVEGIAQYSGRLSFRSLEAGLTVDNLLTHLAVDRLLTLGREGAKLYREGIRSNYSR